MSVKPQSAPTGSAPKQAYRYVARQPILTANEQVFGYELLFRDGVADYFCSNDPEAASRSTLDTSILMGLDILCDGRHAFINCTREALLKDYVTLLPPSQAVVEILETVPVDDLVKAACIRLKEGGYTIALDDFVADDPRVELVEFADFLKVDMKDTSAEERIALVKRFGSARRHMLAEKVETREEFIACKKAGFTHFQGYFFRRPEILQAREIPKNQVNYLRLLQAISREEVDAKEIEDIIKGEASLCYRLLRYLNSASFSFATEIHSVKHGLAILGEREVRRWVRLVAALGAGQNRPSDLVLSALVRARYCELLGPKIPHGESDLFLLGLLSMMDVILKIPMGVVLEGISLDRETRAVLLGQKSQLDLVYQLMVSQEAADWPKVAELCAQLKLSESLVTECHWKAMQWAREMTAGV
ncbi:MAG: HDOD domain-containing protein [Candidatus Sulfotelmatobacter sp.]|jgi:c-di-GMP-related signal transduction protein